MSDIDDLLQQKLEDLENGAPLDRVLEELPPDAEELVSLLQLAAAMRSLPHPEPQAELARAKLDAALRENSRPVNGKKNHPYDTLPVHNAPRTWPERPQPAGIPSASGSSRTAPALLMYARTSARTFARTFASKFASFSLLSLAAAAMLFIFVLAGLVGAGLWLVGPPAARYATLMDLNGQVQIASSTGSEDWWAASTGERVREGQRIRTGVASGAVLLFFDGTRTTLGPGTELTLKSLDGGWGQVLQAELAQVSGRTTHSVVPFRSARSRYIVQSPTGEASVHGTRFDVLVGQEGFSRFAVDSGKVQVSDGASDLFLLPGQVALTEPGGALEEPGYQFSVQGELSADLGGVWVVAGVPFTLDEASVIAPGVEPGVFVSVIGHILETGEWVADYVEPLLTEDPSSLQPVSSFSGVIESMEGDTWTINGWSVAVGPETQLSEGLQVGDRVKVQFTLQPDGLWQAEAISSLETVPEEPVDEPSEPSDPNANPQLGFSPSKLDASGCQDGQITLTGTISNTASGEKDVARDVRLGFDIRQGAQYIEILAISPGSWDSIPPGGQETFTVQIVPEAGWCETLGQKLQADIFIASELNKPGRQRERLSLSVSPAGDSVSGDATQTPIPTLTETPAVTETLTPTLTVTPTLTATPALTATVPVTSTPTLTPTPDATQTPVASPTAVSCTGAQPHPTGMRLAQRYGVPYEEIMGWFCQGFGFGEIDHAYSLSLQTGVPVEEIFAMRTSGLGWGEIKKLLGGSLNGPPSDKPGNGNNGKPNDPPGKNKPKEPPGKGQGNKGKGPKKP